MLEVTAVKTLFWHSIQTKQSFNEYKNCWYNVAKKRSENDTIWQIWDDVISSQTAEQFSYHNSGSESFSEGLIFFESPTFLYQCW